MGKLDNFGDFIGRHWGDTCGLIILFVGVSLEVFNACAFLRWQVKLEGIHELSASLVAASMIVLKLRPMPKNGNGNGEVK